MTLDSPSDSITRRLYSTGTVVTKVFPEVLPGTPGLTHQSKIYGLSLRLSPIEIVSLLVEASCVPDWRSNYGSKGK